MVKTQVRIAILVYVFVAIAKKRFLLKQSLHEILQILSISIFKKMSINKPFRPTQLQYFKEQNYNQLKLFNLKRNNSNSLYINKELSLIYYHLIFINYIMFNLN